MTWPADATSERIRSVSSAAGADRVTLERRAVRRWAATLVLLCLGTLWLEFRHIERTMPYPRHVDEGFIAGPARVMLQSGSLHPLTFNYPSLPKYLTAIGMAVGFLRGASQLEVREIRYLGNMNYPHYDTRVIQTARQLFAALSVIALAATGFAAWLAFRQPIAILLAPLILLASPLFFFHSWTYLNVDIVGTSFVMLTLATCLHGIRRLTIAQSAAVPALFAGLATGSKYTLALVALPVLAAIGLYFTGSRRIWAWTTALLTTGAAFLVAVPFSVIDIPAFLDGVASEAFHYASGHRGFTGEPGLGQFLYYMRHFASEFWVTGAIVAALGLAAYAAADWRRAIVLAVFPAALLWLLASQRVHFPRNVLSLHPFVAMFAAFGLIQLYGFSLRLADRWGLQTSRRSTRAVVALALLLATVPLWNFVDHVRDRTDSRNLAQAWIEEHLSKDWTIVIPTELAFDKRGLEASGRQVVVVDFRPARDAVALTSLLSGVPSPSVVLVPRWGADARFSGRNLAETLNEASRGRQIIERFGSNDVLVNYSYSTPWGDPAFGIAVLR